MTKGSNITLTDKERADLNMLWHLYGNNGPKSNFNQHRFIQTILEKEVYDPIPWSGVKSRKAAKSVDPGNSFNDYVLSFECLTAVRVSLGLGCIPYDTFDGVYLVYPNKVTVRKQKSGPRTIYDLLDVRGVVIENISKNISEARLRWSMTYGKPKSIKQI